MTRRSESNQIHLSAQPDDSPGDPNRRHFLEKSLGVAAFGAVSVMGIGSAMAQQRGRKTGFAYSDITLNYSLGPGHPESPRRLQDLMQRVRDSGVLKHTQPVAALEKTEPFLSRVHSAAHIDSVRNKANHASVAAMEALRLSLGSVRDVCNGSINNAFCAIRPPGHHAHNNGADHDGVDAGEGFCYFNNVAVAARYAQSLPGIEKVLILDWDYHHGNGTEWSFYDDPSVFFFSTHEWKTYPGTGSPDRTGEGAGEGYNLNIPLEAGASDDDIIRAFEDHAASAAEKLQPDLILISAGFDSRVDDRIGTFKVTDDGFRKLTRLTLDLANQYCAGRVVSVLEGGYNPQGLALAATAHLQTMVDG
ncbi:MAG TPA: histone deacetylase [Gammaproteobacteria bacterium]|nr:histone deacetylase [Gammaproteobacteria bacterium]MDP6150882.1 histone deacetylase [Gammaproteobacteria bacterium]HJP39704.1 histone deacetylase [Gammaproteobacteria bacterium]